jgi:hypothetical protein
MSDATQPAASIPGATPSDATPGDAPPAGTPPNATPPGAKPARRSPEFTPRRAFISGFIAVHLIAMICSASPPVSRVVSIVKDKTQPYMLLTGLQQIWAMFSPDPPTFANYLEAEVIYRDGKHTMWKFPLPSDSGYYRRYFMERYRKWGNDYVRNDSFSALWPDACRFIAYTNNTRGVPPDTVKLVRRWLTITPVDSAIPSGPEVWQRYVYYTCPVKPEYLR